MFRFPTFFYVLVLIFVCSCGSDDPVNDIVASDVVPAEDNSDSAEVSAPDVVVATDLGEVLDTSPSEDTGPAPDPCAGPELCDGADNDCDGEVDEDFLGLGNPCDGPDDDFCFSGIFVCNDDPTNPVLACTDGVEMLIDEFCDGEDNDCDGDIDEDFLELGQACDGDDSDSCSNGVFVCGEDFRSTRCEEDPLLNLEETCNGADDDCDGEIDEGDVCAAGPNTQEALLVIDGLNGDMYKSVDKGVTWTLHTNVPGNWPSHVNMVRTGTNVLYLRNGYNNLKRSDDAGLTWTEKGIWETTAGNRAICAAPIEEKLYGTDDSGAVYLSTNQGTDFVAQGSWGAQGGTVGCAVGPDGVLVTIGSAYQLEPTWVSFDQGLTFEERDTYGSVAGGAKAVLTIDSEGTFYAIAGDDIALRSVDQALTWEHVGTIPTTGPGVGSVTVGSDGTLYGITPNAGNQGGHVYTSEDQGVTWTLATDWKSDEPSSGWAVIVTAIVPIVE